MQNSTWAELIAEDCNQALFLFVEKYGRQLQGYIAGRLGDPRDVEECYNDTLYELTVSGRECQTDNILAYACGIAGHKIAHFYEEGEGRRRRWENNFAEGELERIWENREEASEEQWQAGGLSEDRIAPMILWLDLQSALRREKERDRRILCYDLLGFRNREIAYKMDLTLGQVQMILLRIRRRIRERLQEAYSSSLRAEVCVSDSSSEESEAVAGWSEFSS